jgi:hypothetical protein
MIGTANTITARSYVVHSEEASAFWQLSNLWRVFTTGVQTGNSCCLLDQLVMPKGGGPCTHAHTVGRFVRCLDNATKSQFGSQASLSRPSEKAVRNMTIELSP